MVTKYVFKSVLEQHNAYFIIISSNQSCTQNIALNTPILKLLQVERNFGDSPEAPIDTYLQRYMINHLTSLQITPPFTPHLIRFFQIYALQERCFRCRSYLFGSSYHPLWGLWLIPQISIVFSLQGISASLDLAHSHPTLLLVLCYLFVNISCAHICHFPQCAFSGKIGWRCNIRLSI